MKTTLDTTELQTVQYIILTIYISQQTDGHTYGAPVPSYLVTSAYSGNILS